MMRYLLYLFISWLIFSICVTLGTWVGFKYLPFLILYLFSLYLYKHNPKPKLKKAIFTYSALMLCILSFNILLELVDYKKKLGLTINGIEIKEDLKQQNFLKTDDVGINSFSDKNMVDQIYNNQGFRSPIEFNQEGIKMGCVNKSKVMFIGDSHTEGCCAIPITSSFVDLLNKKYCSLNFGIGGMDPLQYLLIAKKYIPIVEPNAVVIPFCIQNDFVFTNRLPKPNRSLYYICNYGWLYATLPITHPKYETNKYFEDWESAKRFYLKAYSINGANKSFLENLLVDKVSLNSFIYHLPQTLENYYYAQKNRRTMLTDEQYKEKGVQTIKEIQALCKAKKIPLIITAIPSIEEIHMNQTLLAKKYDMLFSDLDLYYPTNFTEKSFYEFTDSHFNNQGHRKFAFYLEPILDSILIKN